MLYSLLHRVKPSESAYQHDKYNTKSAKLAIVLASDNSKFVIEMVRTVSEFWKILEAIFIINKCWVNNWQCIPCVSLRAQMQLSWHRQQIHRRERYRRQTAAPSWCMAGRNGSRQQSASHYEARGSLCKENRNNMYWKQQCNKSWTIWIWTIRLSQLLWVYRSKVTRYVWWILKMKSWWSSKEVL